MSVSDGLTQNDSVDEVYDTAPHTYNDSDDWDPLFFQTLDKWMVLTTGFLGSLDHRG